MGRKLVPDHTPAPVPDDVALPGMEPVFWQGGDGALLPPPWYPLGPMIEHLAYSVARTPTDLTAHTQRVLLCLRQSDPLPLFGSLADLFIALGERGAPLRQRLLGLAHPTLPEDLAEPLVAWLKQGRADDRVIPDYNHTVLVGRPLGRPLTVSV
jgi:hypothetical protein